MTDSPLPAPLWRRLAAALYDGLLLIGVLMIASLVEVLVRDALSLERSWPMLRAYLFLVGLVFCGWFWTHGGQTLGMRAWRLRLVRTGGGRVSWPAAALRYGVMVATAALGLLWCLFDARKRALHDLAAGTELIVS